MSIHLLILTHEQIGQSMLSVANTILGSQPLSALAITADYDCKPEKIILELQQIILNIKTDDSVLILTDIYGATPSNIAQHFISHKNIKIITGLNLPMLLRILNYAQLSLDEVCEKALNGGKEGILLCKPE